MPHILALALATMVLVAIPGPNVALIVANSIRHGLRIGLLTVAGTTTGTGVQLLVVLSGFAALIGAAADTLAWVRWAGVLYLVVLGIRTWNAPADDLSAVAATAPDRRLVRRSLLLAIVNPKTLVFNAAFLPQFVDGRANVGGQLAVLAATFLLVSFAGDGLWALAAGSARPFLLTYGRLRNRITGGLLTASGVGLALARR